MVIAIGVLLALVCLSVAAIPFLRHRRSRQTVDPLQAIAQLQAQRQGIYREILTLEEGNRTRTVPDAEFASVTQNLKRRASENLWAQRRWEERVAELDQAVEAIISRQREEISNPNQAAVPCEELTQ